MIPVCITLYCFCPLRFTCTHTLAKMLRRGPSCKVNVITTRTAFGICVWLKPWGFGDFSTFYVEERGVKTKERMSNLNFLCVFFRSHIVWIHLDVFFSQAPHFCDTSSGPPDPSWLDMKTWVCVFFCRRCFMSFTNTWLVTIVTRLFCHGMQYRLDVPSATSNFNSIFDHVELLGGHLW